MAAGSPTGLDLPPMVVMGVSGCGKTTVGRALAARLGLVFRDGDELHPPANIARMTRGEALTDEDRWPWLRRVGQVLRDGQVGIVGCSALRRAYRDVVRTEAGRGVTFVHLSGSREVIAARMEARKDHFMPPSLLASQFATLEPLGTDEHAVTIDIGQPFEAVLDEILRELASR